MDMIELFVHLRLDSNLLITISICLKKLVWLSLFFYNKQITAMKAYQGDSKRGQKRGIHKNYLIYMFLKVIMQLIILYHVSNFPDNEMVVKLLLKNKWKVSSVYFWAKKLQKVLLIKKKTHRRMSFKLPNNLLKQDIE